MPTKAPPSTNATFWAVTTYFNPSGSSRRINNYRCFRRSLSIPLLTIEWHPSGRFQLSEGEEADQLIQIDGGDWMWQKERLLQIALAALPAHVEHVAWLDCDVVFHDKDWAEKAERLLRLRPIIQPFEQIVYLDSESTRALAECGASPALLGDHGLQTRPSFLRLFNEVGSGIVGLDLGNRFARRDPAAERQRDASYEAGYMARPAHGHAWAARRAFIDSIGLYDRCVLGGGDLLFCYGLIGEHEALIANHRSVGWDFYGGCASYRAWAAHAASHCQGRLGRMDGALLHLFHGGMEHRQYRSRIDGALGFGLDLDRDLRAEGNAPWRWGRSRAALNEYFLAYMRNRREDDPPT